MKKFRFRLENALHMREQAEEDAKLGLGMAVRACEQLKMLIQNLEAESRNTGWSDMSPAQLWARQARLTKLEQLKAQAETDLEKAEAEREKALKEYNHRRQQAQIIRKLREKALAEWKRAHMQYEDALLDDLVQSRYITEMAGAE